jgi:hypothetical protein
MSTDINSSPTQITIRPDRDEMGVSQYPSSATRLAGQRLAFGSTAPEAGEGFWGKDGFTARDVVDAINPLEHIPFVSTLFDQITGHEASPASKLIGGALIGGPIGFLASLADVVFSQQTGHSAGGAVVAALTGTDAITEVAAATDTPLPAQTAAAETATAPAQTAQAEILPPVKTATDYQMMAQKAQMSLASALPTGGGADAGSQQQTRDQQTLALFGADAKSAHDTYRKAQFTPYLNDVSHSLVM